MEKGSGHVWGGPETQFFYDLTPERLLDAVESLGFSCTGRCLALNSFENRVYEVEIDLEDEKPKSPSERFRIAKFYRPGRWSKEQILDEHQFLFDLMEYEIPVVAPIRDKDGVSLHQLPDAEIYFCVYPKQGGRTPQELSNQQIQQVGRLLARMHNVGATKEASHRLALNEESYGIGNLEFLANSNTLPMETENEYLRLGEEICEIAAPWFEAAEQQRIHGDCHLGNLLWTDSGTSTEGGPFWVDFDDCVRGPCVQDLWLMIPSRDAEGERQLNLLLNAYEQMREFDRSSLRLIEPLRALRMIHFDAWIAKRWSDPSFPKAFHHFGTPKYWQEQVLSLREQLNLIESY